MEIGGWVRIGDIEAPRTSILSCYTNVSSMLAHWIFLEPCALCLYGWLHTTIEKEEGSTKVLISRGKLNSVSVRESDS